MGCHTTKVFREILVLEFFEFFEFFRLWLRGSVCVRSDQSSESKTFTSNPLLTPYAALPSKTRSTDKICAKRNYLNFLAVEYIRTIQNITYMLKLTRNSKNKRNMGSNVSCCFALLFEMTEIGTCST
jgi:hypothetical protein